MTISAALVLFAVIWFLILFVVLPLKIVSQSEAGEIKSGTPPSAPTNPNLKRKMLITTALTFALWLPICAIIVFELLSIKDLDIFGKLN